jgi:hypothetical protein
MQSPRSSDVELPSAQASGLSSTLYSQPTGRPTPRHVIAAQEVTADRNCRLGTSKRTGNVFKGFWNNSLVAVKMLPKETPVDVGQISPFCRVRMSTIAAYRLCSIVFNVGRC